MNQDIKKLSDGIFTLIDDKKGENIKLIDLTNKGHFADVFIIATGKTTRQVSAMADYISRYCKDNGINPHVEGETTCEWILIDAGGVVIHLMTPETREFYSLEKIWAPELS